MKEAWYLMSKDEIRQAKVLFAKSGGTAGKGGTTNRITLPTSWIKELGITEEERQVDIILDTEAGRIIIEKKASSGKDGVVDRMKNFMEAANEVVTDEGKVG